MIRHPTLDPCLNSAWKSLLSGAHARKPARRGGVKFGGAMLKRTPQPATAPLSAQTGVSAGNVNHGHTVQYGEITAWASKWQLVGGFTEMTGVQAD